MENTQENGFHIMLDETSPYIAGWFAATVLTLMLLKYIYLGQGLGEQGEAEVSNIMMLISFINDDQAVYQYVLSLVKPSVTLATGFFCCAIHAYVYDLRYLSSSSSPSSSPSLSSREESWFVLGCVMAISILLAGLELVWSLQVDHPDPKVVYESFYGNILQAQMDLFYYIIFWLQSFFIVLPFGMIGRHFLEF